MDTPEWQSVSTTGKDLVLKMLSPNPHHRPTVNEILEHPWMRVSVELFDKITFQVTEQFVVNVQ